MSDNHFKKFVDSMDKTIKNNQEDGSDSQEKLMNKLFKLENKFKLILINSKNGYKLYEEFMDFIQKDNILMARIYFRERQSAFKTKIAPAFHKKDPKMLYKLRINYLFAKWAMERYKGFKKRNLQRILEKMSLIRKKICENTLPSVIHRAKIFWSKIPYSHMEYMDMIQAASEGLLQAIDKFEPPFKKVFGSVVVSRMTLNIMDDHNSTIIKIPTKEKRILYRAKNAQNKENLSTQKEILNYVSESFGEISGQNLEEIKSAADGLFSLDHKNENGIDLSETIKATENPEYDSVKNELTKLLNHGILNLSLIERKILTLKIGEMEIGVE